MPLVSVIVPNYNHARFLQKRIDSILTQTFQDFELILLDDCSTDDSRMILTRYAGDPRVRIEFNEVNSGSPFKQWNKGVRMARGEYIWIAESDDYAGGNLLEALVGRLHSDPAVVLADCRSRTVTANGQVTGFLDEHWKWLDECRWATDFTVDGRAECERYLVYCNTLANASAIVFRKEAFERVGGADDKLTYCSDWKLWASMVLGRKVAHTAEILNYYRFHGGSVRSRSRLVGTEAKEYLEVVQWIRAQVNLTGPAEKRLWKTLANTWAPAVLNRRISLAMRLTILRKACALDPLALTRLFPAIVTALRLTIRRRYHAIGERSQNA